MVEKTNAESQSALKKERFEFVLTINGNIVCQRYFHIFGFNKEAYSSVEIVEAIDNCVSLIDRDLKDKSYIYLKNTAPQIFDNKEQMENVINGQSRIRFGMTVPSYIVLRDSEETYVWNGTTVEPYGKNFSKGEYVVDKDMVTPSVLKFAFLDNGHEVCSKVWDGNIYPRFIRNNIDLSSSNNKYKSDGVFAPVEAALIDEFNASHTDLIPVLVHELCKCCSHDETKEDEEYTKTISFGNKTYGLNIRKTNNNRIRAIEHEYRKKTQDYFRGL